MAEISRQGPIIAGVIILIILLFLLFRIYGSGGTEGGGVIEGMMGSWFN